MSNPNQEYKPPKEYENAWEGLGPYEVPVHKLEVPDWRIYTIKGIPELEYVRDNLAQRGLKDPWLRNEVYKYPPWTERSAPMMTRKYFIDYGMKRGFFWAVGVCGAQYLYYKYRYGGYPQHVTTLYDWIYPKKHH